MFRVAIAIIIVIDLVGGTAGGTDGTFPHFSAGTGWRVENTKRWARLGYRMLRFLKRAGFEFVFLPRTPYAISTREPDSSALAIP
jgi:hypothetical protein